MSENGQEKQQETEVKPLAPCPCGIVPEVLLLEMPERAKYGRAIGHGNGCCGEWGIEFRNGYTADPDESAEKARKAWDKAPRAD